MLEYLCRFRTIPEVGDLLIEAFLKNPSKAMFASFLADYGDVKALPALKAEVNSEEVSYLDYIEIRNAIERLGEDPGPERSFDGDEDYEALKLMNGKNDVIRVQKGRH